MLRAALTREAKAGTFTADDLRDYREAWSRPGALTAMLNWYRAFLRFRTRGMQLKVRQPTLILWGDRDSYLEFGMAEESLRFCERGRVVRVEGASHWVRTSGRRASPMKSSRFCAASSWEAIARGDRSAAINCA